MIRTGLAVVLFGSAVAVGVIYWRFALLRNRPESLFGHEVVSPPRESLIVLTGSGVSFAGHDGWIRFQATRPVRFRDEDRLQPCDGAPLRRFFDLAGAAVPQNVIARCDVTAAGGRWVLGDADTGTYLLRSWVADE